MKVIAFLLGITLLALPLAADSAAGITWTKPESWEAQAERPMRAATYKIGEGECAVFYFGASQGGGVQANIDRWIGQFQNASEPVTAKRTIAGLAVTSVDVSGTYMASTRPMGGATTPHPGYRMIAAIVEAPQGSVFFKLTAPAKTVVAEQANFEKMLASIQ